MKEKRIARIIIAVLIISMLATGMSFAETIGTPVNGAVSDETVLTDITVPSEEVLAEESADEEVSEVQGATETAGGGSEVTVSEEKAEEAVRSLSDAVPGEPEEIIPEGDGEPVDISNVTITLSADKYYYYGKPVIPKLTAVYGDAILEQDVDYTVSFSDNNAIGVATVTVTAVPEGNYTGSTTLSFNILPRKPEITLKKDFPNMKVTAKAPNEGTYIIQVSPNKYFSKNVRTYRVKKTAVVKNNIHGRKYYVRARVLVNGMKSNFSLKWSFTAKSTGFSNFLPPGKYTNGLKSLYKGTKYYKNGKVQKKKTVIKNGRYYYFNAAGNLAGCDARMWSKANSAKSRTGYVVVINRTKHIVCVYKGKKWSRKLLSYCRCSTGIDGLTPRGVFVMNGKKEGPFSNNNNTRFSEYYGSMFSRFDTLGMHSVLYKPYSRTSLVDGRLGLDISQGCVRLAMTDAQYIFTSCPLGSCVIIY